MSLYETDLYYKPDLLKHRVISPSTVQPAFLLERQYLNGQRTSPGLAISKQDIASISNFFVERCNDMRPTRYSVL